MIPKLPRFSLWLICYLALSLAADRSAPAATLESAIDSVSSKQLREYVEVLANDMFEGRETGSRGGTAAGNYLSQHSGACSWPAPARTKAIFKLSTA